MPEARQEVLVKEFPPELEGERVAWISVQPHPQEADIVCASVAYARIAADGARYAYISDEEAGRLISRRGVTGFVDSTELDINGYDGSVLNTQPCRVPRLEAERFGSRDTASAIATRTMYTPSDEHEGTWAVGAVEITQAFKSELVRMDAEWLYPAIYYNLCQMAPADMLLADTGMHDTTQQEAATARRVEAILSDVVRFDKDMLKALTIFGDYRADDIPNVFTVSRRAVHDYEVQLSQKAESMYSGRWYMPIGARPNGRTWPYMDPTIGDEDRAFGMELQALKQRNTEPARSELVRELRELGLRQERAAEVGRRLRSLLALEQ